MGGHCVFVHTVWAIEMINCCFTANELRVTVSLCECLYSLSGLPLEDSGGYSNDPPAHPMNPLNSMKPSLPPNPQRYTHTHTHTHRVHCSWLSFVSSGDTSPALHSGIFSLIYLVLSGPVSQSGSVFSPAKTFLYLEHWWQMWLWRETAVQPPSPSLQTCGSRCRCL